MTNNRHVALRRRNLLIEIGTEELPPKSLNKLAQALSDHLFQSLLSSGMTSRLSSYRSFATPRRLATLLENVAFHQSEQFEERLGPSIQAAFFKENHQPTKAAFGFAKSCGVDVSQLKVKKTAKGEKLMYQHKVKGEPIRDIVTRCLEESIQVLPLSKKMRWGSSRQQFVRPVHWVLALYGNEILHTKILGLKSNRITQGHRFHSNQKISILSADLYASTLKSIGYVIADFDLRKATIEKKIIRLALKVHAKVTKDKDLLEEVTGLVEWPQVVIGKFDNRFLDMPQEVLISSMKNHQKYFHLTDSQGKLLPFFITVSNIKSKAPKQVRTGNEKVLQARLCDAEFFWKKDQCITLEDRIYSLKKVIFHHQLGSMYKKSLRIENLALIIATELNLKYEHVSQAARLCKTDLLTDMVKEFPELQGIIGRYYAIKQGEHKKVADAIDTHYMPRFSGDQLPDNKIAQSIALADRLDTLVGLFSCGEIPSGDKDPCGLRRSALGVLRILIEKKINLDVLSLIKDSYRGYGNTLDETKNEHTICEQVFNFLMNRLKVYYQNLGFRHDQISAVMTVRPCRPLDFDNRLKALREFFRKEKQAAYSLALTNKRISNILAKTSIDSSCRFKFDLITDKVEKNLSDHLDNVSVEVSNYFSDGYYTKGFAVLATLKSSVDSFFEQVTVMDSKLSIRTNRLALLKKIRTLFLQAADISMIRQESV